MLETLAQLSLVVVALVLGGGALLAFGVVVFGSRRFRRQGSTILVNALRPIVEELAPALDTSSDNMAKLMDEVDDLEQAVEQLVAGVDRLEAHFGGIDASLATIAGLADRAAGAFNEDRTGQLLERGDAVAGALEELPVQLARVARAADRLEDAVRPLADASSAATHPLRTLRRLGRPGDDGRR